MQVRYSLFALCSAIILAGTAHSSEEETVLYGSTLSGSNAKPCGNQGGDSGLDKSDPIDLSTGGFQHSVSDLIIPGRGLDFEIKRMYRSYGGMQARIEGGIDPLAEPDPNPAPVIGERDFVSGLVQTPIGQHWDFNYNMRVSFVPPVFEPLLTDPNPHASPDPIVPDEHLPAGIDVMTGRGRIELFNRYSPSTGDLTTDGPAFYSHDHFRLRVKYSNAENPVQITDADLTTYEFFGGYISQHSNTTSTSTQLPYAGRLKTITDRNGNQIIFTWETSPTGVERIDFAVDTLDHTIDFIYHDEQFNNQDSPQANDPNFDITNREQLIWVIKDHAERAFEYNYVIDKGFPMLASVTTPAIENTVNFPLPAEHERFQSGQTWSYAYDNSNDLGPWFSGRMLTSITSPNGDIITENEYEYLDDGVLGRFDVNDSRVKRQRYGNAYYNYIVTDIYGEIALPFSGDTSYDYYVWLNDRRGAITRFKYAGSDSTEGFHRQLLERVEFEGLDPDPDHRIWAKETSPGVFSWRIIDPNSTLDNEDWVAYSGPEMPDGSLATEFYTQTWDFNDNWDSTGSTWANLDKMQRVISDRTSTDDPLSWGSVLSSTISSADNSESITESWRYDFALSGAGGGCGCGSVGFYTAHKDGKGFVTIQWFDGLNGNLLAVYRDLPPGTSMLTTGVQAQAMGTAGSTDVYGYNQYGQVVTHTHPSKMILNAQGNEVSHSRVDQYEYYSLPDQNNYGRLHKTHIDVNGFDLITTYEYDAAGNVVKRVDPDGDITLFIYNQKNELVQEQSFDATESTLFAQTDYFYDANGNLVKQEVLDLDGDQQVVGSILTINEYDTHDYLVTSSREAGVFSGLILQEFGGSGRFEAPVTEDAFITQKWIYDGGKNLIEFRNGEAVNGIGVNQIDNIVQYEYDARDLRIKKIQGDGSASPLITAYEYDENERGIKTIVNPDNILQSQTTEIEHDAFNRITVHTDPMGNVYQYQYDDNHNAVSLKILGSVVFDTEDSLDNEVLAEASRTYGELDLRESQSVEVFSYDYSLGIPNSSSAPQISSFEYNEDSSLRKITTPAGNGAVFEQTIFYDTVSRIEFQIDIAGKTSQYEYDADSNVANITQTDISTINGALFEFFEVQYEYDALDRRTAAIDGVGNRTEAKYDSRSNAIDILDARGHTNAYTFDSMNRLLSTSIGDGTVIVSKAYDASNRLVSETDHNGNETTYEYDGLNRLTKIIMPDGEFYRAQYDASGNMSQYTDARGVIIDQTFDLNNRLITRDQNTSGTQVPGMTEEENTYDGLGRLRISQNDFSRITHEYDSRSNITRELQNINAAGNFPAVSDREVAYEFDLATNTTKLTYPGGRNVYRTFDELNRMIGIFNDDQFNDPITEFEYIGRRLQRRKHGNGTRTDYIYNGIDGVPNAAGDFGFGRVAGISTTKVSSGNTLDAFAFAWDEIQNRSVYDDTGSGMKNRRERAFGYDAANRLVSSDIDFPDPMTDFSSPTNNGITTYTLDGVYNRTDVSGFESNGAPIGTYSQAGDHVKNNQYTITPRSEGGEWMNVYDKNGNISEKYQLTIADFNGDHTVNFFDVSAFLAAYQVQDPSTDLNNDGVWNFFDVSAFTGANSALDGTTLEQWYYTYDFRNQLIEAKQVFGTNEVISKTTNTYDAAARRVIESLDLDDDGVADAARHLIYGCASQWEVLEQIDIATDTTILTHVYGLGIDDEVSYQFEDQSVLKDIWTHRDDLNSLTSITDSNGDVQERYEYGDYGKVAFFDAGGISLPSSGFNAQHLFTGRSLISGTGLYDYRFRVMEPETGGFIQRDPIGYKDGMNLYAYVKSSPVKFTDPMGLHSRWDMPSYDPNIDQTKPYWIPFYSRYTRPYAFPSEYPSPYDMDLNDFPDIRDEFRGNEQAQKAKDSAKQAANSMSLVVGCPGPTSASGSVSGGTPVDNTYNRKLFPLGNGRINWTVTCVKYIECDECGDPINERVYCTANYTYLDAFTDPFDTGHEPGTPYPIHDDWYEPVVFD